MFLHFFFFSIFLLHYTSASCVANGCKSDADCTSCGYSNTTNHAYASFPYICQAKECILNPEAYYTQEFEEAATKCKLGIGYTCCDIRHSKKSQLSACAKKSCRIPTGCSLSGDCEYDLSKEAQGQTINCCSRDRDCPPYSAPAFWDYKLATQLQKTCESVRCDRYSHNCVYKRDKTCCTADSPDCNSYTVPSSVCAIGACVYEPNVLSAPPVNPFIGQGSVSVEELRLRKDPALVASTYSSRILPRQCSTRIKDSCECTSDADCASYGNKCAKVRCVKQGDTPRRVCVSEPLLNSHDRCCMGNRDNSPLTSAQLIEQCMSPLIDPCLIPVSCDSLGTTLHDQRVSNDTRRIPRGGLLLPTFKCDYVRRVGTASCCAFKGDCKLLADVNECVIDSCVETRCALSRKGHRFMDMNLPCCHTTKDCYRGRGETLAERLNEMLPKSDEDGSCSVLQCTGDSQSVPDSMRHKCMPKFMQHCPSSAASVEEYTKKPATTAVDFNGCSMAMVVHISILIKELKMYYEDIPLHSYPKNVTLHMDSPDDLDVSYNDLVIAAVLLDDVSFVEFKPDLRYGFVSSNYYEVNFELGDAQSELVQYSLNGLHLHLKLLFDTQMLTIAPSNILRLFSRSSDSHVRVVWLDNSESMFSIDPVDLTESVQKCISSREERKRDILEKQDFSNAFLSTKVHQTSANTNKNNNDNSLKLEKKNLFVHTHDNTESISSVKYSTNSAADWAASFTCGSAVAGALIHHTTDKSTSLLYSNGIESRGAFLYENEEATAPVCTMISDTQYILAFATETLTVDKSIITFNYMIAPSFEGFSLKGVPQKFGFSVRAVEDIEHSMLYEVVYAPHYGHELAFMALYNLIAEESGKVSHSVSIALFKQSSDTLEHFALQEHIFSPTPYHPNLRYSRLFLLPVYSKSDKIVCLMQDTRLNPLIQCVRVETQESSLTFNYHFHPSLRVKQQCVSAYSAASHEGLFYFDENSKTMYLTPFVYHTTNDIDHVEMEITPQQQSCRFLETTRTSRFFSNSSVVSGVFVADTNNNDLIVFSFDPIAKVMKHIARITLTVPLSSITSISIDISDAQESPTMPVYKSLISFTTQDGAQHTLLYDFPAHEQKKKKKTVRLLARNKKNVVRILAQNKLPTREGDDFVAADSDINACCCYEGMDITVFLGCMEWENFTRCSDWCSSLLSGPGSFLFNENTTCESLPCPTPTPPPPTFDINACCCYEGIAANTFLDCREWENVTRCVDWCTTLIEISGSVIFSEDTTCAGLPCLAPDATTFSPTPAPTARPSPTFSPTPLPPTPRPTTQTLAVNGTRDLTAGDNAGCLDGPWEGPVPLESDITGKTYTDSLPETVIQLDRIDNTCLGCPFDFTSTRCSKRCRSEGGSSYSYLAHFSIINIDTDREKSIPEGGRCTAKDSLVMILNATGCTHVTAPRFSKHHCTSILPIQSSVIITPEILDDVINPGVSIHAQSNGDHSFFVLRGSCLPIGAKIEFDVRIEGCTEVRQITPTLQSCFDVTARLITGKCQALLTNWTNCEPNEFGMATSQPKQCRYPYSSIKCIARMRHLVQQTTSSGAEFSGCPNNCSEIYPIPIGVETAALTKTRRRRHHKRSEEGEEEESPPPRTIENFHSDLAAIPADPGKTAAGPVAMIDQFLAEFPPVDVDRCIYDVAQNIVNETTFTRLGCFGIDHTHQARQVKHISETCGALLRTPRAVRFDTIVQYFSGEAGYDPVGSHSDDDDDNISGTVKVDFGRYQPRLSDKIFESDDDDPVCTPLRLMFDFRVTGGLVVEDVLDTQIFIKSVENESVELDDDDDDSGALDRIDRVTAVYKFGNLAPNQGIILSLYYISCDLQADIQPDLSVRVTVTETSAKNVNCKIAGARDRRCSDRLEVKSDLSNAPETVSFFSCDELRNASIYAIASNVGSNPWKAFYVVLAVMFICVLICCVFCVIQCLENKKIF